MKLLWYIIAFAALAQSSCASTSIDAVKQDTTEIVPQEVRIVDGEISIDHFDLDLVLAEWRKDTIACMGLRDGFKVLFLIDKLNWFLLTRDDLIKLLGSPNTTLPYRESAFSSLCRNPDEFTVMRYYYSSCCYEGKLYTKGACWLEIVVYKDSGKVKDAYWACD